MDRFDIDSLEDIDERPEIVTEEGGHMARPYFDRQMNRGCKVIFSWRPGVRWPGTCAYGKDCVCDHIEGIEFPTPQDAMRLNLSSLEIGEEHLDNGEPFKVFSSWGEANAWLNGGD